MTLRKRDLVAEAQARLQASQEVEEQDTAPGRLRLAPPASLSSQSTSEADPLAQLVERFGHVPTNPELRTATEEHLPPMEQPRVFQAVGGVLKKGAQLVGKGAGLAASPVAPAAGAVAHGVNVTVVRPGLKALDWWNKQLVEPLSAVPLAASLNPQASPALLLLERFHSPTTLAQERGVAGLSAAVGRALEERRLAGDDLSDPTVKLAAYHEGFRTFTEKQSLPAQLVVGAAVDPIGWVPIGKIPLVAKVAQRLDPITAVARGTLKGHKVLPFLNETPQGRLNHARDVTTDLIDDVARLPLGDVNFSPVTADDAGELLHRIGGLVGDPASKYRPDDLIPALAKQRNTPLAEELALLKEAIDAGWKDPKTGTYNFDILQRMFVSTDKPDALRLRNQVIGDAIQAYGKVIGTRQPAWQITFRGMTTPSFPTPMTPKMEAVGFSQLRLTKGKLPKDWKVNVRQEMERAGAGPLSDMADLSDIDKVVDFAKKHGLVADAKLVYIGKDVSPLQRLAYGVKKQLSPLYLGMNPAYFLANPISNYSLVFLRHGLETFDYPTYSRLVKEGRVPLGQFASESFGMSGDAVSQLVRDAKESLPWIERIPLVGNVPRASRELQQRLERHAHLIHMTIGYGKALRKLYGNNLEELVRTGKIPPAVYEIARHARTPDDFARLLKAGDVVHDAADLIPWATIRDPLAAEWLQGRLRAIRQGSTLPIGPAGRPVTPDDVRKAVDEFAALWGPNGEKRRALQLDVDVYNKRVNAASHPLNSLEVPEPDNITLPQKYVELKADMRTNHAALIEAQQLERKAAEDSVRDMMLAKNHSGGWAVLNRMAEESIKAAILSTQKSDDMYFLLKRAKDAEEYKRLTQTLFDLRSGINRIYTDRVKTLAADYVKSIKDLPVASYPAQLPPVQLEADFVHETLAKYGLSALDPTVPEDTIAQLLTHVDDTVADMRSAYHGFQGKVQAVAPPIIDPQYHEALSTAFNEAHLSAQRHATMMAQHDLYNYGYKTSLDMAENIFSPYPFWSGRFLLNMGTRILSKPQQFEMLARIVQVWYNDTKELPPSQWFTAKLITLDDGTEMRFRPWNMLFPLGWPALQLVREGSDKTTVMQATDLLQTLQKTLGLTPYPYWELAAGLVLPNQVDATGFGVLRTPAEIQRSSFPLLRTAKSFAGGLQSIEMLNSLNLLSEADVNHAIGFMREDMAKGLLGPVDSAEPAIDSALEEYRKGNITPLMKQYMSKVFREGEMWKLIPTLNISRLSPEQREAYAVLKAATMPTDDGTAPSQLDKSKLANDMPELFVGGRWKYPANLPAAGRLRQRWEETQKYQYELSQINHRADMEQETIAQHLPEGRGLIAPLQRINDTAQISRLQAKADHPQAATDRTQLQVLQRDLGKVPLPVHPLDAAYDAYIAILQDPAWINPTDLSVDYKARQKALDAWHDTYDTLTGQALGRTWTAEEYRKERLSQDTPAPILHYYQFLDNARGYFQVVDQLPPALATAYESWKSNPSRYAADPRVALAREYIRLGHEAYRRQYLQTRGPSLELDLQKWLGLTPLWMK